MSSGGAGVDSGGRWQQGEEKSEKKERDRKRRIAKQRAVVVRAALRLARSAGDAVRLSAR